MGVRQGDAVSSDVSLLPALPTPVPLIEFSSWQFSGRNLFFSIYSSTTLLFSYLLKKFPLWNSSRIEENHLIGMRQTVYFKKTKSCFLHLLSVSRIRNYDFLKKNSKSLFLLHFMLFLSLWALSSLPWCQPIIYLKKKLPPLNFKLSRITTKRCNFFHCRKGLI